MQIPITIIRIPKPMKYGCKFVDLIFWSVVLSGLPELPEPPPASGYGVLLVGSGGLYGTYGSGMLVILTSSEGYD